MAIDCEKLSPNAQAIFDKLKPFFPPDGFKNARWEKEGQVYNNMWFDLRKSAHRVELEEKEKGFLGYLLFSDAHTYRKEHGSLENFTPTATLELIRECLNILLILADLDYQIETGDLVD